MKNILFLALLVVTTVQSQSFNNNIENITPDSRYTVHDDGTVTDILTGLMWKQCEEGLSGSNCATGRKTNYTWQAALALADTDTQAGYTDWRLPNIKELRSLVAEDRYNPNINLTVFPNAFSKKLWSGSPFFGIYNFAWTVYDGYVKGLPHRSSCSVRLVRDGQ